MTKWEYLVIVIESWSASAIEEELENLGSDGWELVTVRNNLYIFKRPK